MNVACPECRSVFRVDPAKIPGAMVRARCAVCGGVITVSRDGAQAADEFTPRATPAVNFGNAPTRIAEVDHGMLNSIGLANPGIDRFLSTTLPQLADLAVLSADYFSVPDEEIKRIESVLTIVDGKVVHGSVNSEAPVSGAR